MIIKKYYFFFFSFFYTIVLILILVTLYGRIGEFKFADREVKSHPSQEHTIFEVAKEADIEHVICHFPGKIHIPVFFNKRPIPGLHISVLKIINFPEIVFRNPILFDYQCLLGMQLGMLEGV